ncbi:MAG: hypothetical protein C0466_09685 [Candidatus Accumulibacter sp.]|nr:hypothetical protein [Accumulibacter sp.]
MKATWQKYAAPFDAMSRRERALICAAVLGGIAFVGLNFFIEPALKRASLAERGIAEQRSLLSGMQAQIAAVQGQTQDPDRIARGELAELKRQLGEVKARFSALERELVPPQNVVALLDDLIGRQRGLRLLSLRTLPVTPLLETRQSAAAGADAPLAAGSDGLFKHGVEIRVEGSYQELSTYLAQLEKSPLKLLWSGVALSAENHPRLVLTLTVYTLSLDRTWLIV